MHSRTIVATQQLSPLGRAAVIVELVAKSGVVNITVVVVVAWSRLKYRLLHTTASVHAHPSAA